jgi:hypothetical protein
MPAGDNLHRNVIFRNAVAQAYPTTYIETPTAEGLWQSLEKQCLDDGQRLRRARDPAQLERVERAHVHRDALGRRAAHRGRRARAREARDARRGDAAQGRQ